MKSELMRISHELQAQKEKIKENTEKIKVNKTLPYLVSNVIEVTLLPQPMIYEYDPFVLISYCCTKWVKWLMSSVIISVGVHCQSADLICYGIIKAGIVIVLAKILIKKINYVRLKRSLDFFNVMMEFEY